MSFLNGWCVWYTGVKVHWSDRRCPCCWGAICYLIVAVFCMLHFLGLFASYLRVLESCHFFVEWRPLPYLRGCQCFRLDFVLAGILLSTGKSLHLPESHWTGHHQCRPGG